VKRLALVGLVAVMAGCSWRGEPKQPIDAAYHACKQTCKGTCAADGTCLPPIVEDGK